MNTIQVAMQAVQAALQSDDVPPYDTQDRALWRIRFLLAAFYDGDTAGEDTETPVNDLLTDLVHYAEAEDLNLEHCLERGEWMAAEELKDWGLTPVNLAVSWAEPEPEAVPVDEDGLAAPYTTARQGYWDAQKAFRWASIAEVQRVMPDGVTAFIFAIGDDPELPRLTLDAYLDEAGVEQPAYQLEDSGVYDAVDRLAADMEAFSWEEANSFLLRAEDRSRFIIDRPNKEGIKQ
jgi:hypothetical protein